MVDRLLPDVPVRGVACFSRYQSPSWKKRNRSVLCVTFLHYDNDAHQQRLLSPGGGIMYLVAVQDNRPEEIMALVRAQGLRAEVLCACEVGVGAMVSIRITRNNVT